MVQYTLGGIHKAAATQNGSVITINEIFCMAYFLFCSWYRRDCVGWCDRQRLLETVAIRGQATHEGQAGVPGAKGGNSGSTGHSQKELWMGGRKGQGKSLMYK